MTRIPEIKAREQLPEGQRGAWDEIAASRGSVRGPFTVLLHSPELARRTAHLGAYVRFESSLPAYTRELAVLIAARLMDCEYEYAAHRSQLQAAGASEATLAAVDQRRADQLDAEDRWVYALVEELLVGHRVSEATFRTARAKLGDVGLVELVGGIGYYAMLAATLNAFEVEPADGA